MSHTRPDNAPAKNDAIKKIERLLIDGCKNKLPNGHLSVELEDQQITPVLTAPLQFAWVNDVLPVNNMGIRIDISDVIENTQEIFDSIVGSLTDNKLEIPTMLHWAVFTAVDDGIRLFSLYPLSLPQNGSIELAGFVFATKQRVQTAWSFDSKKALSADTSIADCAFEADKLTGALMKKIITSHLEDTQNYLAGTYPYLTIKHGDDALMRKHIDISGDLTDAVMDDLIKTVVMLSFTSNNIITPEMAELIDDDIKALLIKHNMTIEVIDQPTPYTLPKPLRLAGRSGSMALSQRDLKIDKISKLLPKARNITVAETIQAIMSHNGITGKDSSVGLDGGKMHYFPIYSYEKDGVLAYTIDTLELPPAYNLHANYGFTGFAFINENDFDKRWFWVDDGGVGQVKTQLVNALSLMQKYKARQLARIIVRIDGELIKRIDFVEKTEPAFALALKGVIATFGATELLAKIHANSRQ